MIQDENKNEDTVAPEMEHNSNVLNNIEIKSNPTKDFFYFVFDLLKTGIIVFILAFCLRYFVIQPFIVDGESMMPNYVNNEYLLAEKISYLIGSPQRGDVVIFRYPGNPSISYIKRIIALPGERITISNNTVRIFNNEYPEGKVLSETAYLPSTSLTLVQDDKPIDRTLGQNEYFVMGDNRQHSSDSRDWGVLPKSNIIGRSWLTLLPTDKFGVNKRISAVSDKLFSFASNK